MPDWDRTAWGLDSEGGDGSGAGEDVDGAGGAGGLDGGDVADGGEDVDDVDDAILSGSGAVASATSSPALSGQSTTRAAVRPRELKAVALARALILSPVTVLRWAPKATRSLLSATASSWLHQSA